MPNTTERHHHGVKPPNVARSQEGPKRDPTRLHEMRHKEIETVPGDRDGEAPAKTPCTVAVRKSHDDNINQCMEKVKKPKLWNNQR